MEHKIGTKITFPNGDVVEVKEEPESVCIGCIFDSLQCGVFRRFGIIGECEESYRTDKKNIIYKEVKELSK